MPPGRIVDRVLDVGAAAEVHYLAVGGNQMDSRCLHLRNHSVEINHFYGHRRRAGVADAQVELGAGHAAKLGELYISGRAR